MHYPDEAYQAPGSSGSRIGPRPTLRAEHGRAARPERTERVAGLGLVAAGPCRAPAQRPVPRSEPQPPWNLGEPSEGVARGLPRTHGTSFPTILGSPSLGSSDLKAARGVNYLLSLHFLGLSGLPGAGWLEQEPGYELFIQAAGSAKRLRPRVPAPPKLPGKGDDPPDLRDLVPNGKALLRLDERVSMRLAKPAEFLQVDVWEERSGLLDIGAKAPIRKILGQCYVPLEPRFNKRPCTWAIVNSSNQAEVGYLTVRFGLATTPAPVRNLRIVEGATSSTEVCLAWDPPVSDGGTPLRGYRIEAREATPGGGVAATGFLSDEPCTASAPPSPAPTATLRSLRGNTAYTFRVWAVSEAGPGPCADIFGCTGAVPPGVCGWPRASDEIESADLCVEWNPPSNPGGAAVVAYRVWLRALFQDGLGNVFPADSWIDLGLSEHRGGPADVQRIPVRLDALPACSGCLCSVAALNAAGHMGPSTREVPVFWARRDSPNPVDIWELGSGEALSPSAWTNDTGSRDPKAHGGSAPSDTQAPAWAHNLAGGAFLPHQAPAAEQVPAGPHWGHSNGHGSCASSCYNGALQEDEAWAGPYEQLPQGNVHLGVHVAEASTELYMQALRTLRGDRDTASGSASAATEGRVYHDQEPAARAAGFYTYQAGDVRAADPGMEPRTPARPYPAGVDAPSWALGARGSLVAGRPGQAYG